MKLAPLVFGTALVVGVAAAGCGAADGDTSEPVPPADSLGGAALVNTSSAPNVVEVQLVAAPASVEYLPGKRTTVWAYRDGAVPNSVGTVPGPRLEAKRGDEVIVHFRNELPEPTTIHWHGLRLPIAMDGSTSSQASIPVGGTFDYRFRVQDAGTFWFHPHVRANEQIEKGLYAPFVVKGEEDIDVTADRTFILDDVKLAASGELASDGDRLDMMVGKQGNVLLLNGRRDGTIAVGGGDRQRWRFVNAANGRYFLLRLPGHSFVVIGSDGGLLSKPYMAETLLVAPGERYEVLVSFDDAEGARIPLETLHYDRGHELPDQGPRAVAQIVVGRRGDRVMRPVPAILRAIEPLVVSSSKAAKHFLLQEREGKDGPVFSINDETWPFNQAVMVKLGESEIWEVESPPEMDHPFHLHGMFFQVLGADGKPDETRGWKDTVNVKRGTTVRFAVRYEALGMWMFHCHILEHAERGMMGDLMVMP